MDPHPEEIEQLRSEVQRLRELLSAAERERRASGAVEEALRQSEERFRLLVKHSNDVIVILDPDGTERYVSESVERITGFPPETFQGQAGYRFVHPEDVQRMAEALVFILQEPGRSYRGEYRHLHKNGGWVHLEAVGTNLLDDPRVQGIVMNVRDVTARKQAELERERLQAQLLQAQKMESIGRLAGGVAHDFNNLLTAIIGNLSLALSGREGGEVPWQALQDAIEAAQRAAGLTRQLLAFGRKQILAPVALDLNLLLDRLQRMLKRLIGADITLNVEPAPAPAWIRADPGQIEQVIVNLVVNARDAMPRGGFLELRVECADADAGAPPEMPAGPRVGLLVRDTGEGMDENVRAHLFEPFFTTKPDGKGTGLGLATVYGIVRQHRGSIAVDSAPGSGTCFRVWLPREEAAPESQEQQAAAALPAGHEVVLLAEDETPVRQATARLLRHLGYPVLEADGPIQALRLACEATAPIGLLLTDVVMPGLDGRELARQVQALHPGIKVLYTSGHSERLISEDGTLEPGLHFLPKPFTLGQLSAKLREVLGD